MKISVIIDNNEQVWFNANDSATALEYKRPRDTIKKVIDSEDKIHLKNINTIKKSHEQPMTVFLSESGIYNLIIQSRMPCAKKFKRWITTDILPSIRKYGNYKMKLKYEKKLEKVLKDLNFLKSENSIIKADLKKENFPTGGIVYAINYSENGEEIYRIGMTFDMNKRKAIYNTHTLHKKNVSHMMEFKCPLRLETCIRSMLYEYRYKNKKDYYVCNLAKIKQAFKKCKDSINCMDQNGGAIPFINDNINALKKKKINIKKKLKLLNNE